MPSQQEVRWSQLKVGVIVLVAAVILVTLLFLMTSSSGTGLFDHRLTVYSYFSNSSGLKPGAAVNLQGVTIGTVKSVNVVATPDHKAKPVQVTMRINGKYAGQLKEDSKAALTTIGVLGDTVVDISSQYAVGPVLQDGEELHSAETTSINDVIKSSQGTLEQLNGILAKMNVIVDGLQSGKGTVGQLLTNPALYNKLNDTVGQLNTLSVNLNKGKGTAGKLLNDDALYTKLNDTVAKLDNIVNDLDAGKGSAGKLLKNPEMFDNLNSTLKHANSLLAGADEGKGTLGLFMKDPKFRHSLNDTVEQIDTLLANTNQGKGTLGKLATDDSVHTNLNHLLTNSSDLVTAIRKDPKRYLTIHLKLF